MGLAACHPSDALNFETAPRFFKNVWTPGYYTQLHQGIGVSSTPILGPVVAQTRQVFKNGLRHFLYT